jgi:protein-disulfide isomerase
VSRNVDPKLTIKESKKLSTTESKKLSVVTESTHKVSIHELRDTQNPHESFMTPAETKKTMIEIHQSKAVI